MDMQDEPVASAIRSAMNTTPLVEQPSFQRYAPHPGSRLSTIAEKFCGGAPYWAYLWPGGSAHIQHMLDDPAVGQARDIFDFGCGSGMAGIVAKSLGAARVSCFDSDPVARAACRLNASLNCQSVDIIADSTKMIDARFDLILAGDVFYDAEVADSSLNLFHAAHGRGARILVGDIGRRYLPRHALREIANYSVKEVGTRANSPAERAGVFEFRG